MAYGQVLKAARRQKGISQEELAALVGVDRTYPSLLERAERSPTLVIIINVALALELRPGKMIDDVAERLA